MLLQWANKEEMCYPIAEHLTYTSYVNFEAIRWFSDMLIELTIDTGYQLTDMIVQAMIFRSQMEEEARQEEDWWNRHRAEIARWEEEELRYQKWKDKEYE